MFLKKKNQRNENKFRYSKNKKILFCFPFIKMQKKKMHFITEVFKRKRHQIFIQAWLVAFNRSKEFLKSFFDLISTIVMPTASESKI